MGKSFLCIQDKCKIGLRKKKIKKVEVEILPYIQHRGVLNG